MVYITISAVKRLHRCLRPRGTAQEGRGEQDADHFPSAAAIEIAAPAISVIQPAAVVGMPPALIA